MRFIFIELDLNLLNENCECLQYIFVIFMAIESFALRSLLLSAHNLRGESITGNFTHKAG
jgi:hypothetical protein